MVKKNNETIDTHEYRTKLFVTMNKHGLNKLNKKNNIIKRATYTVWNKEFIKAKISISLTTKS